MHLTIASRTQAGRLLMTEAWTHLISIGDDDHKPAGFHRADRRLRLVFDDLLPDEIGCAPTVEDVTKIMQFARAMTEDSRVLIHCAAGISRSTAAAMIVLMVHGMTHFDALQEVRRIRPIARPNQLMLAIYRGLT